MYPQPRFFSSRLFANNILYVGNEIGRLPPQFQDASKVADVILSSGFDFDKGNLYYNEFRYAMELGFLACTV